VNSVVGYFAFAIAIVFLLISLGAAITTRVTGRFSSGVHIVPTVFAFVGTIASDWSWIPFFAVAVLDLGSLFLKRSFKS
jgi:hypothetical protein